MCQSSFLHSVVKGNLYLFGGASSPDATECLPGVYRFDIGENMMQVWSGSSV